MRRMHFLPTLLCALAVLCGSAPAEEVALRLTLGIRDRTPTPWNGEFILKQGKVVKIEPMQGYIKVVEPAGWKGKSWQQAPRRARQKGIPKKRWPVKALVFSALLDVPPTATIGVKAGEEELSIPLAEFPIGSVKTAGKKVRVERIVPARQVTTAKTQDDYPSVCVAPDDTARIAYISYTDGIPPEEWKNRFDEEPKDLSFLAKKPGGDQLHVVTVRNGEVSEPTALTKAGQDLYGTALAVDGNGRTWIAWSANVEGNWDLYARCCEGDTWGKPHRLTGAAEPDVHPVMATMKSGKVWLVWQAFRGDNADIMGTHLDGDTWSKPITIGKSPKNEWFPAVAVNSADTLAVAWDTYQKGDYDVYYATVAPDGTVSEARPAAASLKFEANPSVTYDKQDRLWIAWEEGPEKWAKDFGPTDPNDGRPIYRVGRWVRVKCFVAGTPHHTASPLEQAGDEKLFQMNNNAVLSCDEAGRVWLVFRHREATRGRLGGQWLDYAMCFNGKAWSGPALVSSSDGVMHKKPALVPCPDGAILAVYNSDARMRKPSPINDDIWMARLSMPQDVADASLEAEEPVQVAEPIAAVTSEAQDVARARAYRVTVGGKEYHLARGEWHRHTEISGDGANDGTILDMFRYGIDVTSMDWIGNGDHDNGGGREYSWWTTQKLTDAFHVGDKFVPMFTYERSVRWPDGHRNPMFTRRGIRTLPRLKGDQPNGVSPRDTKMLYRYLRQFNGLCSSHTSATDMGTDWRDNDPELEPVIEIFQGCRRSYEYDGAPRSRRQQGMDPGRLEGYYWKALEKGYIMGIQSSSDHSGTHISYAIVYVEEPTREAVFDGLKKRHSYGATDNIIMDARMGDHMMGDVFKSDKPASLDIKVIGTDAVAKVDIIKNNKIVYTQEPNQRDVSFAWQDKAPQPGRSYYYVRALQKNNEIAWASPMWIDYEK